MVQDEGIPLVWVPRGEIVSDVLAAPDRQARIKILLARSGEVMQDCRDVQRAEARTVGDDAATPQFAVSGDGGMFDALTGTSLHLSSLMVRTDSHAASPLGVRQGTCVMRE